MQKLKKNLEKNVLEHTQELNKINRAYKALRGCNHAVVRAKDETELLQQVCRIIWEDCGYRFVWIGFAEHNRIKSVKPVAQAGFEEEYLNSLKITWSSTKHGSGPTGTAIRTGKPVIFNNILTNPDYAPWQKESAKRGYSSSAAIPLAVGEDKIIGALNVYSSQPDAFIEEEINLLSDLAGDLAYGIVSLRERSERKRVEEELYERDNHSRSLLSLSRNFEQAHTYSEVLDAALFEVRKTLGYQTLAIYLLTENKKEFKVLVAGGPISDTILSEDGTATITIEGDRMMEEIVDAKEIVIVEDAQTDERVNKEIVMRMGLRTIVNVPIILFDRNLGSVGMSTIGDEGVRIPSSSEQKYLIALASHMAVSLDRVHLFTERNRAAKALEEKEHYFRSLLYTMHEDILVIDRNYRITDVNNTFLISTGQSREKVIGKHCYEISHGYNQPCYQHGEVCMLKEVFETGEYRNCQHKHFSEDGVNVYVDILLSPLIDEQKNVTRVIEAVRDISEQIKTQEALRESEELHRITIENIFDPVFITDDQGNFTYICSNVKSNLGYLVDEIKNMGNIFEFIGYNMFDLNDLNKKGILHNIEIKLKDKSGNERTFLLNVKKVSIKNGTILFTLHDITERKQAELKLINSEREFRTLAENIPHHIMRYDINCRAIYVNHKPITEAFFTSSPLGKSPIESQTSTFSAIENYQEKLESVLETGVEEKMEFILPDLQSNTHIFEANFIAERDDDAKIIGAMVIGQDITQRKQAEEAMKKRKDKLERFERLTIGRELAMVELKKRITELETRLLKKE